MQWCNGVCRALGRTGGTAVFWPKHWLLLDSSLALLKQQMREEKNDTCGRDNWTFNRHVTDWAGSHLNKHKGPFNTQLKNNVNNQIKHLYFILLTYFLSFCVVLPSLSPTSGLHPTDLIPISHLICSIPLCKRDFYNQLKCCYLAFFPGALQWASV